MNPRRSSTRSRGSSAPASRSRRSRAGPTISVAAKGWLAGAEAKKPGIDGGTPLQWALETHQAAQQVWQLTPASLVLDESYYDTMLPVLDRQLGVAGLRLARFLIEAFSSDRYP